LVLGERNMVNQNQENKLENSEPSYEYDERATQMLAEDVMAGDLVRGLIELITNSDDGYNRLEEKGKPVKNATILVNVDRSSKNRLAVVKDKADGIGKNKKEAREKLRWYGRRLSGRAEGGKQRGNFGFGLKDIIGLGNHKIESIRDGYFVKRVVEMNRDPDPSKQEYRDAKSADYDDLGVKKSGTKVSLSPKDKLRINYPARLRDRLTKHFMLRHITTADNRKVILEDSGLPSRSKKTILKYTYPKRKEVYSATLKIKGYQDSQLIIYRNEEIDTESDKGIRSAGILVWGQNTVYDNTLFKHERDHYSKQFSGEIHCPEIDELLENYEDEYIKAKKELRDPKYTERNPERIINFNRHKGLLKQHPYYEALEKAVSPILQSLIKKEESTSATDIKITESSKKIFRDMGFILGRLYSEDLDTIEDSDKPVGPIVPTELSPITLKPKNITIFPNESMSIVVEMRQEFFQEDELAQVSIEADPENSLEVLEITPFEPTSVTASEIYNIVKCRIKLRANSNFEYAHVTVKAGSPLQTAEAEAKIAEDIEISFRDEFEFFRHSVSMRPNERKRIRLYIPVELHDEYRKQWPPKIWKEEGVGNQHFTVDDNNSKPQFDEEGKNHRAAYYQDIEVTGKQLGAECVLRAQFGGQYAKCKLKVSASQVPKIDIKIEDIERGFTRIEHQEKDRKHLITIIGQERSNKKYILRGESGELTYDIDNPATLAYLTELISGALSWSVVHKWYNRNPQENSDGINAQQVQFASRYVRNIQKEIISSSEPIN